MGNKLVKDMTTGSPMKHILGFSVPLLFGFLFQQFYNLVDTMIVGRSLGVEALGAVGSTGAINFLILGFCMGVSNGFSIPMAQCFGAKDYKGMRCVMMNAVYISIVFTAVLTVLTVVFCMPILKLMKTPSDIIGDAYSYIVIIFMGIPVAFLYNLVSGFIRSMGESKVPVYYLVLASFINIGLDLLFILVFHMGVAGAALATVISQLISGVGCLAFMIKKYDFLRTSREERKFRSKYALKLCGVGIPMGLQYSITAIGSIVLQSSVNMLGSLSVSAMATANKVGMFFCCPFDAMGSTMATYGGQNVGAGKIERLSKGLKAVSILGIGYSVLAFVVLLFSRKFLVGLFVGGNAPELVVELAARVMLFSSSFYIPLAFVNIIRFLIQGMGASNLAVVAGVCEMVARAGVGFFLVPKFGFTAACIASPIAWILADIFLFPAYFYVLRKLRKAVAFSELPLTSTHS